MVEYAVKFFEHLREAIYRRALLEYVESARSENKKQNKTKQNKTKWFIPAKVPDCMYHQPF